MTRTRILLADDSVSVQRIIELTFVDEDVDVVAVGGGREAIEDIRRQPPDIVLADTRMPDGDGYEVAAFVHGDPQLARIPVVLLTGAFDPVDDARAREVGSSAVLVKPFEAQQVIGAVRDLLATRTDGAADAVLEPAAPPASEPPPAAADAFEAAAGPAAPIEQWPQPAEPPPPPVPPPADPAADAAAGDAPAAGAPLTVREGSVLADAFAALLASEQADAAPGAAPPPSAASPRFALPEAVVADVAERVAGRLTDAWLRERAAAVVAEVAERVVREEIARTRPGG